MIADCGRATRLPVTRRRVAPDSVVYSDGWSAYDALPAEGDQRERGNRGEGLVPAGGRPSSGAENFWNRAKRHLRTFNGMHYERDGAKVFDLTYAGRNRTKVTAYLVTPATGKGPHAGLVFGHWGPGNRTEFLAEAKLYARAGAVCVLVDYPWVRPAPHRKPLKQEADPEGDHALFVEAVIDLRRALDLLAGRSDVDPKRLGYVGHSFGAQWGASCRPSSRG